MREICLDTETTGLDPKTGHKIVEIACIELIDKVKTGNNFHIYVNPRRDMPQEAFNVHGISSEFLQDKQIFDHIAQKFLDFIADDVLVIHNAAFDLKFLNFELSAVGMEPLKNDIIDTLKIARKKFPGSPSSLDALCRRFSIDLSRRTKHGALLDTDLLADVYVELMGGAQVGFGFIDNKIKEDEQDQFQSKFEVVRRVVEKRVFEVSAQDLEAHKEFVEKNIKNNLWYE